MRLKIVNRIFMQVDEGDNPIINNPISEGKKFKVTFSCCPLCGEIRFYGHQVNHHDIIVDESGNFEDDRGIYESGKPFGPFTCTNCSFECDSLPFVKECTKDELILVAMKHLGRFLEIKVVD